MPSKWPYSSNTSAMCTADERMARSTSSASARSSTTGAGCTSARTSSGVPSAKMSIRSLRTSTPMIESGSPSCTGSIEWCDVAQHLRRISSGGSDRSITSTSRRGVIRPRAERSARRMTPEIIALLVALEHALALGLGDDGLDLFVGDALLASPRLAEQRAARRGRRYRAARPAARRPMAMNCHGRRDARGDAARHRAARSAWAPVRR